MFAIRADAAEWPVFPCTLFVRMRTNSPCLQDRYSCVCGRIARVCVYAIRTYTDGKPVFACTLFVRILTNSPFLRVRYFVRLRINRLCLRVRYSCVYAQIGRVCVSAVLEYADEEPVFASTLYLCMQTIRPCLHRCYSCVYGRIGRVWVYAVTADAVE